MSRIAKALNQSFRRSIRHLRSSLRISENTAPSHISATPAIVTSPRTASPPIWTTQEPYIPPVDYIEESIQSNSASTSEDPPPIYATLDPQTKLKVLKMLQRAGIRRSVSSGLRSSARRLQQGGNRSRSTEENALVSANRNRSPATLELQGMDHLAFDHEIV